MLRRTAVNCARKLETWKIKNCVKSWLCTRILSKIRLDTLFGSKQHYLSIFKLVFLRKRVFDFLIFAKNHEKCHFSAIFGKFSCLYEALGGGRNFYMTRKNFSDHIIDKVHVKLWIMSIRHVVQKVFAYTLTPLKSPILGGGAVLSHTLPRLVAVWYV